MSTEQVTIDNFFQTGGNYAWRLMPDFFSFTGILLAEDEKTFLVAAPGRNVGKKRQRVIRKEHLFTCELLSRE